MLRNRKTTPRHILYITIDISLVMSMGQERHIIVWFGIVYLQKVFSSVMSSRETNRLQSFIRMFWWDAINMIKISTIMFIQKCGNAEIWMHSHLIFWFCLNWMVNLIIVLWYNTRWSIKNNDTCFPVVSKHDYEGCLCLQFYHPYLRSESPCIDIAEQEILFGRPNCWKGLNYKVSNDTYIFEQEYHMYAKTACMSYECQLVLIWYNLIGTSGWSL